MQKGLLAIERETRAKEYEKVSQSYDLARKRNEELEVYFNMRTRSPYSMH